MKLNDKEFYEELSNKMLSDQDFFEVKNDFVGFFNLLYCIDKRNKEKKKLESKILNKK